MRLIDADKLICHLSDYMLQESPDETMSNTNDFSEYNLHQVICETIKNCIEAVKEAETVNKWISVSEKLPKENSYVLVCCKDGFIGTDDYFSYGFDDYKDEVIAWQPLPEPCEVWNGVHGQCLQPKGSFEKIFNGEEENDDDI